MSQARLAALAHVSRPTVVGFEAGKRLPHPATLNGLRTGLERLGIAFVPGGAVLTKEARIKAGTTGAEAARNLARTLRALQRNREKLERLGVRHLSLFGSMARGEAGPESDVDVMVELDPDKGITLFDYAGIGGTIEDIIGTPVDLAQRDRLKPYVKPEALRDEIRVF